MEEFAPFTFEYKELKPQYTFQKIKDELERQKASKQINACLLGEAINYNRR